MSRSRSRRFLWGFLLVSLLLAGVGSFYASSRPDGLEAAAERTGFSDTAEDSAAAGSPLADYSTTGVDDPRISGGLAGVAGSLLVLVIAGAVFRVVRRRGDERQPAGPGGAAPPSEA